MKNYHPFFFDGAFGTFYEPPTEIEIPTPEEAVLADPDGVLRVHKEYIAAGADAIKTDTFAVNPRTFPDREKRRQLIRSAMSVANEAVKGSGVLILADIGPIVSENAEAEYIELVRMFLAEGAENFLFETQSSVEQIRPAIELVKSEFGRRITVTFAVGQDGRTETGRLYSDLMLEAADCGADSVGLNCMCGPTHIVSLLSRFISTHGIELPESCAVVAMPNAGYPSDEGGRAVYRDNPQYFASRLSELASVGVSIYGGCCGTTPRHIRALKSAIGVVGDFITRTSEKPHPVSTVRDGDSGGVFIAAELSAPDKPDISWLLDSAARVRDAGADCVTIPDSPLARARADSMLSAAAVRRAVNIPVLPHLSCRDRNRIALRGALISSHIEGVRSVLAVTGDPLPAEERDNQKTMYSFNSFGLIEYIKSLNAELFSEAPFRICGALNISAKNFSSELTRASHKLECGCDWLLTQPLYTREHIDRLRWANENLPCRILAGIMPPATYRNAVFLNNEVPGISIPDDIVESLRDASPEDTRRISVGYAEQIISSAAPYCGGFYLMTPMKHVEFTEDLIRFIRSM